MKQKKRNLPTYTNHIHSPTSNGIDKRHFRKSSMISIMLNTSSYKMSKHSHDDTPYNSLMKLRSIHFIQATPETKQDSHCLDLNIRVTSQWSVQTLEPLHYPFAKCIIKGTTPIIITIRYITIGQSSNLQFIQKSLRDSLGMICMIKNGCIFTRC